MIAIIIMSSVLFAQENKTDEESIVCGEVVSMSPPETLRHPYRLHLVSNPEDKSSVKTSLIIWPSDMSNLEIRPSFLVNKGVCITGRKTFYRIDGSYEDQILINNYKQIVFVSDTLS
jgi:hypothetical protein